jgi:hypothetical protein
VAATAAVTQTTAIPTMWQFNAHWYVYDGTSATSVCPYLLPGLLFAYVSSCGSWNSVYCMPKCAPIQSHRGFFLKVLSPFVGTEAEITPQFCIAPWACVVLVWSGVVACRGNEEHVLTFTDIGNTQVIIKHSRPHYASLQGSAIMRGAYTDGRPLSYLNSH